MPRACRNPAAAAAGGGLRKSGPGREGRGRARSEILQAGKSQRRKEKVILVVRSGGAEEGTAAAKGPPRILPLHPPRGQPRPPLRGARR